MIFQKHRFPAIESFFVLMVAVLAWLGLTAWLRPLALPDEGRYAGVALAMLQGGWAVPLLDGMPFFHKPPLFYWVTAAGLGALGANEFAARTASLLGAVACAAALYLFLRRRSNTASATAAVLVLVTQPLFFGGAQYANLDMLVAGMISLCIVAAAEAILRAEQGEPHRWMLTAAYLAAALAVLAKGLIGMVLPAGVMLLWLLWRGRLWSVRYLFWLPAMLVFFAVSLPWFLLMQARYPGFFDYFVVYHHFRRFAETGFNNAHPFWFYFPVIFLLALPWTAWLWRACRRSWWSEPGHADVRKLMWVWFAVIVLFFSLPSSKLVGYVLPALPPLAFLIADTFISRMHHDAAVVRRTFMIAVAGAAVLCMSIVVAASYYDTGSSKPLVRDMAQAYQPDDEVVMLDEYYYDVPFYLRLRKPVMVVSQWDDPAVPRQDNWRKELYDAGQFDPELRRRVLITPQRLHGRLCEIGGKPTWIFGHPDAIKSFPELAGLTAYAQHGDTAVWRLTADTSLNCGETPRNG